MPAGVDQFQLRSVLCAVGCVCGCDITAVGMRRLERFPLVVDAFSLARLAGTVSTTCNHYIDKIYKIG